MWFVLLARLERGRKSDFNKTKKYWIFELSSPCVGRKSFRSAIHFSFPFISCVDMNNKFAYYNSIYSPSSSDDAPKSFPWVAHILTTPEWRPWHEQSATCSQTQPSVVRTVDNIDRLTMKCDSKASKVLFYLRANPEKLVRKCERKQVESNFRGVMMIAPINSSPPKSESRKPLVINWKRCSYENNSKSD